MGTEFEDVMALLERLEHETKVAKEVLQAQRAKAEGERPTTNGIMNLLEERDAWQELAKEALTRVHNDFATEPALLVAIGRVGKLTGESPLADICAGCGKPIGYGKVCAREGRWWHVACAEGAQATALDAGRATRREIKNWSGKTIGYCEARKDEPSKRFADAICALGLLVAGDPAKVDRQRADNIIAGALAAYEEEREKSLQVTDLERRLIAAWRASGMPLVKLLVGAHALCTTGKNFAEWSDADLVAICEAWVREDPNPAGAK